MARDYECFPTNQRMGGKTMNKSNKKLKAIYKKSAEFIKKEFVRKQQEILFRDIETVDGVTDAYSTIENCLEQQYERYGDEEYYEALKTFKQIWRVI